MPINYWLKFGDTPLGYGSGGLSFTHVEQPGTLTVSLVGTGSGFDNTKTFDVLVTFGSAIAYTVDGTPVATPSATCTLSLHSGQSRIVGNIPSGTTYSVTEQPLSQQDLEAGYSTGSVSGGTGTMTDAGAYTAVAGYTWESHEPAVRTLRFLLPYGYTPRSTDANQWKRGATWTKVEYPEYSGQNVWDLRNDSADWSNLGRYLNSWFPSYDVIGGDLHGVTDVSYLFGMTTGAQSHLQSVALFYTGDVLNFEGMFYYCTTITSVPLFDTHSATNMSGMFNQCYSLVTSPVFDTHNVENMFTMYDGCKALTSVPLLDTSSVWICRAMFANDTKVEGGALALYSQMSTQATPPTNYVQCFYNCGSGTTSGSAELAQIPSDWK